MWLDGKRGVVACLHVYLDTLFLRFMRNFHRSDTIAVMFRDPSKGTAAICDLTAS
jgi:hypothetical protein